MLDLAASAITALGLHLPPPGGAVRTADDEAPCTLYSLLDTAFRTIGAQSVWDQYVSDPRDATAVQQLLAAALREDTELAGEVERAMHEMTDNSRNRSDQSHASTRGDNSSIVGRDQDNSRRNNFGGVVAVVAVIIVAVVAIWAGRAIYNQVQNGGLDKDSTCQEFLQASQEDELNAIRKVGIEEGVKGIGSPLALPAISYSCSSTPNARLGDVIVKFKGQF
ncbi:hypothetical protein [Dactylosporangium sp. NPDC048998]|uniref:hypothetical protein n=1 Tax=Dactylosporangium sp. NPDC048998 TaxID=3363976 RepID=UPI00371B8F3A